MWVYFDQSLPGPGTLLPFQLSFLVCTASLGFFRVLAIYYTLLIHDASDQFITYVCACPK
jgi:hypothetical protein